MRVRCYGFEREPTGRTYVELIEACFKVASSFGLVVGDATGPLEEALLAQIEALRPFRTSVERVNEWPGTTRLGAQRVSFYRYAAAPGAMAILLRTTDHLFGWSYPDSAEDLCFFRDDGSVILTTTTHEQDAYLKLIEHEMDTVFSTYPALRDNLIAEEEFDDP